VPRTHRKRITTRVALLSVTGTVLLGVSLVFLIAAVTGQRDAARATFRSQEALTAGSQLESSLISIENGLRGYVASGRRRFLEPALSSLRTYPGEVRALTRLVSDEPGQQRQVRLIDQRVDDYVTLWVKPLLALFEDSPAQARSVVVTNGGRTKLAAIQAGFARLFASERRVIGKREDRAESRSSTAIGFGVGGIALLLTVVAVIGWYLRRAVVGPLRGLGEATTRLAHGELEARVPHRRDDEIGDLARSFNAMASSLQHSQAELAARTDELEQSNSELVRSNSELEQFASVTSHDLQAPLVTISMYAELLDRRHGGDLGDGAELLDGIRGATGQARTLIRDLLEYSRAGRGELSTEEISARAVVDQALEHLAGAVEASSAQVSIGPLPVVRADRGNLSRVFQNLVGNAIKFTAGRVPEVTVGADRVGAEWRFWVRDNGIGMQPEDARRIFEPFQRLHGEEVYAGSGIGLAVCERIVTQHGGRMWVDSRPGQGSEFSFTLPALGAAVVEPERREAVRASA
jgi:signal transduction histidine kinase